MLSIFAVPKPFVGHDSVTQTNAIRSWKQLGPTCQVILCGNEQGSREVAEAAGVELIEDVAVNDLGTPILSSVFEVAQQRAAFPLVCYVNADIILLPDFLSAVHTVARMKPRSLVVGQRWDLDVIEQLTFGDDWVEELAGRVSREGVLHPPWGSDFFVFPRGLVGRLPDFAVGRPAWDNWMIYHARNRRIPVIDVTGVTTVVHQNHGYTHVRAGTGPAWEGVEAERNRALVGGAGKVFTLADATHRLTSGGLVRVEAPKRRARKSDRARARTAGRVRRSR